jgi:hypothetical protein
MVSPGGAGNDFYAQYSYPKISFFSGYGKHTTYSHREIKKSTAWLCGASGNGLSVIYFSSKRASIEYSSFSFSKSRSGTL